MCKLCWERMCLELSRPDSGCPSLLFWCICTVSQTGHCIMENSFWCHSHLECDIILSRRVDACGYEQKENTYVLTYAVQIHKHGGTAINAGLYHVCSVLLDSIIYTTAWLLNTQWHPHRPARTRSGRGLQLDTALMSIGLRLQKSQWGPESKNVTVTKMWKNHVKCVTLNSKFQSLIFQQTNMVHQISNRFRVKDLLTGIHACRYV